MNWFSVESKQTSKQPEDASFVFPDVTLQSLRTTGRNGDANQLFLNELIWTCLQIHFN